MVRIIPILVGILLPLAPAFAQVDALHNVIDFVTTGTPLSRDLPTPILQCPGNTGLGACRLAGMFVFAVQRSRAIVGAIAFLIIVVAGFRLIISQNEESLTTARRTIMGTVLGLFLLFISEPFVDALYGGFTRQGGSAVDSVANVTAGANIITAEMLGIFRWIETLVAIVAIALLVVQAIAVLGSFGDENIIRKAYRAAFSTVIGLLFLVFDRTIAAVLGYSQLGALPGAPDASILIVEIFGLMRLLLAFVGIIVVAIMVYSGFLMIANFGNEDFITKGKQFLLNAALGLLLIVISFVLISTVILGIT